MTAETGVQQALPFPGDAVPAPRHPAETELAGDEQRLVSVPGLVPADDLVLIDQDTPGWLAGADFVVVDVETTGWLADAAVITEIGAVRLSKEELSAGNHGAGNHGAGNHGAGNHGAGNHGAGNHGAARPGVEFSALVDPGIPIPPAITELTGITDQMVAGAPTICQILPDFLEFAAGGVLVAHNASFDVGFLAAACEACGIGWPPFKVIDTAILSRLALGPGDVPDHKLITLAGYFETGGGPWHRALDDAKATVGVLAGLLGLLARR